MKFLAMWCMVIVLMFAGFAGYLGNRMDKREDQVKAYEKQMSTLQQQVESDKGRIAQLTAETDARDAEIEQQKKKLKTGPQAYVVIQSELPALKLPPAPPNMAPGPLVLDVPQQLTVAQALLDKRRCEIDLNSMAEVVNAKDDEIYNMQQQVTISKKVAHRSILRRVGGVLKPAGIGALAGAVITLVLTH